MGIFDKIEGAVGGGAGANISQEQHESLMQHAMQMFGNRESLNGLVNNAQSHGLGGVVQSWIGNGANQSIDPNQAESLVGQDRIQQLAQRVGIPAGIASMVMAKVLPMVVDRLTPQGKIPQSSKPGEAA